MRRFLSILALTLTLPAMALAAPVRTYCEVNKGQGSIANQFFFEVDAEKNDARVVDGIILHFIGQPIEAKINENSAKKMTLTWSVRMTNNRGQQTKMSYRAAILKETNRVLVHAQPHGYRNNFTARGRCQRTQNPLPTR